MPELPDVENKKQYLDATSLHKDIRRAEVKDDSVLEVAPQTLKKHLESQSFEDTARTGKYLFAAVDAKWLVLHFGMTGGLSYAEDSGSIPDHTRVLFHFEDGGRLAYTCQRMLGSIDMTDHPEQFIDQHDLGDDALQVNLDTFRDILNSKRGMIKTALMDQSTIAGIGNIYSDEMLYQSHIHPKTKINDLDEDQVKGLHGHMQRILNTAISNQADPEEMPDSYLIMHRQEGASCPNGDGTVKRIEVSGRGCYICPDCQQKQ